MQLGVAVVNWNSGDDLRRLLRSLLPIQDELERIVVVDNGSRDGSLEGPPQGLPLEVIELDENLGFAAAANRAIERLTTSHILLLNPDIEVCPGSLLRLKGRTEETPRAAILTGPLQDEEGRLQTEFQLRPLPTPLGVLREVLFFEYFRRLFIKSTPSLGDPKKAIEVEQPAAAFWLLRREAWEAARGFDESFFPAWFEDVDLCKRLASDGWQMVYYPDCPFFHRGGSSLRHLGRRRFLDIYYGNLLKYLGKHHPGWYPLLWGPVQVGRLSRRIWARS